MPPGCEKGGGLETGAALDPVGVNPPGPPGPPDPGISAKSLLGIGWFFCPCAAIKRSIQGDDCPIIEQQEMSGKK